MKKYQWEVTGRRAPRENVSDPDRPIIIISDSGPMPVKAGKTVHYHSILNDLYDVTVPGTYVLRVEKIDPTTNALVKSNTLPIVVAKPPTH
jgi:hypothetical protein